MAESVLLRLVECEALKVTSSASDALPLEVARLVGSYARELRTRGDGACGPHAAFAIPGLSGSLAVANPRWSLRTTLGYPLEVIRSRVRPTQHHLLQPVLSSLWEFALLCGSEAEAARAEEGLFLHHLRMSAQWDRVAAALGNHRERQANLDAQDAIAQQLSRGIFRRSLDARLWQRLTMTAGVEEEYASPPWEMRNGY